MTVWSVSSYRVNIEQKDQSGKWVPHGTIPVGANEAHSAGGYTGFGAGAPPTYLTTPGTWRLNAQAVSPRQSGLSNWVEFYVTAPPSPTALKKKIPDPWKK